MVALCLWRAVDRIIKIRKCYNKQNFREADFATHYHYGIFIVALIDRPLEGAREAAQRLRQKIANERFRQGEIHPYETVSVNVGLTTYRSLSQKSEELIVEAKKALTSARKEEDHIFVSS